MRSYHTFSAYKTSKPALLPNRFSILQEKQDHFSASESNRQLLQTDHSRDRFGSAIQAIHFCWEEPKMLSLLYCYFPLLKWKMHYLPRWRYFQWVYRNHLFPWVHTHS